MSFPRVQALSLDTVYTEHTRKDDFTFTPSAKWIWLQKLCFWFLRKIGANTVEQLPQIQVGVLDTEKLADLTFRQIAYIYERHNEMPTHVLMGTQDFDKMADRVGFRETTFAFTTNIHMGLRGPVRFLGLAVCVVPWMRGVVVLPPDNTWRY